MGDTIRCVKGLGQDDAVLVTEADFKSQGGTKLSDLRKILQNKQIQGKPFINSQTDEYRFLMPETEKYTYNDRVIADGTEAMIEYTAILKKKSLDAYPEILLTNIKREKKPDLIGYDTDYWCGGKLRVQCTLRNDSAYSEKNRGKFQPVMLEDVISSNPELHLQYDKVCICCEDSVIQFNLRSWGTLGFEYRVSLGSGEIIRENGRHWNIGDKNLYGNTTVYAWSKNGKDKDIVIKATENVAGIDPATKLKYQKLTFVTRDFRSWRNGKTLITVDTPAPTQNSASPAKVCRVAASAGKEQQFVPGESITPGTLVPGDDTTVSYGDWNAVDCDPWEQPQGSVTVFLFVFTSMDAANRYFGKYDLESTVKQRSIWEI